MKVIVNNKKAYFEYEILDKLEAGIALFGWEVKSIRNGYISLKDSFIRINEEEAYLVNANVSRWKTQSPKISINQTRERKLLLHASEIEKLKTKTKNTGLTVVPLQIYLSNNNRIKVEIGVARGKRKYDKREKIKNDDIKKQIDRDLKEMRIN